MAYIIGVSQNYASRLAGTTGLGGSVLIPKRVGAAYQDGRSPASVVQRLCAQLIDWALLVPFAFLLLVFGLAADAASGGRLVVPLRLGLFLLLMSHWFHTLVLEGGPRAGSLGKRGLGLGVVAGYGGASLGAGPAAVRRAIADLWILGSFWLAFRLTAWRQLGHPFSDAPYDESDWLVWLVFLLVFLVPWLAVRTSGHGCQWLHDRLCGAVVVVLPAPKVVVEPRPVAPVSPLPPQPGEALSLVDKKFIESVAMADSALSTRRRRRGPPPASMVVSASAAERPGAPAPKPAPAALRSRQTVRTPPAAAEEAISSPGRSQAEAPRPDAKPEVQPKLDDEAIEEPAEEDELPAAEG